MLKSAPETVSSIFYKWLVISGTDQCSDEEYINYLYKVILNRNASAREVDNWISILNNGISRKNIIDSFILSEEFTQLLNQSL